MNVVDALRDPDLLGAMPCFRDLTSWGPWLTFLKCLHGLPLTEDELQLFRQCTGRDEYRPPRGGYSEAYACVGRQSGKSRIAGTLAAFTTVTTPDSGSTVALIAQDQRASLRIVGTYAKEALRLVPAFTAEVRRETEALIETQNGASLAILPCRPASVRGLRCPLVVVDEAAFFQAADGRRVDEEMLKAVRPSTLTTGGKVVVLSSPYGASGVLYSAFQRHWGQSDSPILFWRAASHAMNPTLDEAALDRIRAEDPIAAQAELDGLFLGGVADALDSTKLDECTRDSGDLVLTKGVRYYAHVDPSGGRNDAYAAAITHAADGRTIVDAVRWWDAPLSPQSVTGECAEWLRAWGLTSAQGDRYAGAWPGEEFRKHGITYNVAERTTSEMFLALVPLVHGGRVELPRDERVLRELRQLERRRGSSGRDHIEARRGCHDDVAAAVSGAIHLAAQRTQRRGASMFNAFTGRPIDARQFERNPLEGLR